MIIHYLLHIKIINFLKINLFYLKFKFICFNWRLITLQYYIGLVIHQHESTTCVHVFPILKPLLPPSPYYLSGSSQCTSPKHPVSCIEPRLAIHFLYDIIHFLKMLLDFFSGVQQSDSVIHRRIFIFFSDSFLI